MESPPERAAKICSVNTDIIIKAARLPASVKSVSHPLSNKEIKKQKKDTNTPEDKLDKNGNPIKFSRDMESD